MAQTHKQDFLQWAQRNNVSVLDAMPNCDLHKGQMVMFTNDYGVTFGPHEVLGFAPEPTSSGRCVYFDHDAYWLPARPDQLTPVSNGAGEEAAMMKQFREIKAKHPDAILLFRVGDFYEAYEDDAVKCADTLGIILTTRSSDRTRMAAFPHHALDTYLPRLVRAGSRVAICDQLEAPKPTVKRGITELVSPNKTL